MKCCSKRLRKKQNLCVYVSTICTRGVCLHACMRVCMCICVCVLLILALYKDAYT